MNKKNLPDNQTNFLLYTGNDGKVNVEVFLKNETVWLTQKAMAELFRVKIPAISKHLSNIFESGELHKGATLSILETVQKEGSRNVTEYHKFKGYLSVLSPSSHCAFSLIYPCVCKRYASPFQLVSRKHQ